jgi:hypothetical protein
MRENSELVIWKEKEQKLGVMVENMKVTSRMVRKMVKVLSYGLMAINILEVGNQINNMVWVFIMILKLSKRSRVNGLMAKDINGLIEII